MEQRKREYEFQDNENFDKLKRSIVYHWEKYTKIDKHTFTETSYLISENLDQIFEESPSQAIVIYDTLLALNIRYDNREMVQHIKSKKAEYLNQMTLSSSNR